MWRNYGQLAISACPRCVSEEVITVGELSRVLHCWIESVGQCLSVCMTEYLRDAAGRAERAAR